MPGAVTTLRELWKPMVTARVVIDPNRASRAHPGLVAALRAEADRDVEPGDLVTAVQPDDDGGPDFIGNATVRHVTGDLIYLDVAWESFHDETSNVIFFGGATPRLREPVSGVTYSGNNIDVKLLQLA